MLTASTMTRADELTAGRIAIIHASKSTILDEQGHSRGQLDGEPKLLKQLRDAGVQVIGRYMARCFQPEHPTKMLIKGGTNGEREEVEAIFDARMAVASIYQYRAGDEEGKEKFTRGLADGDARCENTSSRAAILEGRKRGEWLAADEGTLDAEAAVEQARRLKQPKKTVIYFGVDYLYEATASEKAGIAAYFQSVRAVFSRPENDFKIGAYGNGAVLTLLLGEKPLDPKLVDHTWISPSRGYERTSEFHSGGRWSLMQSQSDNNIMFTNSGVCFEYEYDTDIQNIKMVDDDLGFWFKDKLYEMPSERTKSVFNQRRFICSIRDVKMGVSSNRCNPLPNEAKACVTDRDCSVRTIRVLPTNTDLANPQVDFWDYGGLYSHVPSKRLTASMLTKPLFRADERNQAKCLCSGSNTSIPCNPEFQ
jgi:hypothetical protein